MLDGCGNLPSPKVRNQPPDLRAVGWEHDFQQASVFPDEAEKTATPFLHKTGFSFI